MRTDSFDIVVYGATPGGIAAAVTAARQGHTVALVEYHKHLGGMTSSGLGKSDVETREAIGGFFREFVQRVEQHYIRTYGADHANVELCQGGYYYEPSVAEGILVGLVKGEASISVLAFHVLEEAIRDGERLVGIRVVDRATGLTRELRGRVFVDGSYEGDLAACAGAEYRIGREARSEYNELHAGVIYMDYETRTFLAGTTGEGDRRLPAYTFRLCLTDDPANAFVLSKSPPGYDRQRYLGYFDDLKAGRLGPPRQMHNNMGYHAATFNTMVRALSLAELPNRKFDANINPRPLGFPFPEENDGYPEGTWEMREAITEKIRNLTLGLLYFLQNDHEIPLEQRKVAQRFHLAKDEFTDHGHFPWQLYIREARRIVGEYTLSENDLIVGPELGRTRIHADSIAAGEFPMDSFPVRKRQRGHDTALEGYILMLDKLTHPYQIPYRIIVPKHVDNLLVPVAASATHVAFSTIRLEPTWMALGQGAGLAAHLALRNKIAVSKVNVELLQRELLAQDQVLTFFSDVDRSSPAWTALQFFGTKGFFPDYHARPADPMDRETAHAWISLALGQRGRAATDLIEPSGLLLRAELNLLLSGCGLSPGEVCGNDHDRVLTRGEFCRILFERLFAPAGPAVPREAAREAGPKASRFVPAPAQLAGKAMGPGK